ncbi:MAG: response regulator [Thermodesulfobacteriota bacterium]|nr:response regulator [Thermodesulfobacteriota bacterium]
MENRTILVVEDDEKNMKLVRALLSIGKYDMLEALDAETGIQLARKHQPDLILMDIQLPKMDGLSAIRIIKEDTTISNIPIMALTSYAMQKDMEKAKEAGCVDYITKPIDTKGFLKTLSQFFYA